MRHANMVVLYSDFGYFSKRNIKMEQLMSFAEVLVWFGGKKCYFFLMTLGP